MGTKQPNILFLFADQFRFDAIRANGNEIVKTMLQDDGSGMYEIEGLMDAIRDSIAQYGYFPITVPAIPLISPHTIDIKLTADDVAAMRRRIEDADGGM